MSKSTSHLLGTPEQLRDPDYTPPLVTTIALGIQHVLAMFASNVAPAFIVAGAANLAGSDLILLIQAAMNFAGVATLIQSIGFGPIGARLPVVQGTSFAFLPIMVPIAKTAGMAAVLGGESWSAVFSTFCWERSSTGFGFGCCRWYTGLVHKPVNIDVSGPS